MAASLVLAGTTSLQNAVANGDTRTITLHHTHSGESGSFTFKKDGRYDQAVLAELNHFLRDWRNQKSTQMDPHLFDIVWEVYREVDASAPIQIVSSYRSPETNSMLRSRSSGVAKFSQHMLGKAMDFYIPGVNLTDLRVAGLRLQRGGVGFYPTSGSPFVHMDTGNVRHWPRMTHDQLVRVFPDGKTVHVPTDGRPLAKYDVALAEIQARGSKPGVAVADAGKGKNFFASLFGKKDADDDEGGETPTAASSTVASGEETASRDTPASAPARAVRTASATMPVPPTRPAELVAGAMVSAQATRNGFLAPLPLPRPAEADRDTRTASFASAPVPLPSVITRGTEGETGPVLGYASAGSMMDQRMPLTGGFMAGAHAHPPAPVATTPVAAASAPTTGRQRTKLSEIAFGRLFLSPSLSNELYLRVPEMRQLATFMAPPREVVATAFSRDGSFGLKARFAGTAVADLPTYVFRAPQVAYNSQRM